MILRSSSRGDPTISKPRASGDDPAAKHRLDYKQS